MRILVTNDDGVHAAGLAHSVRALQPHGELFVVAPDSQRSACGHCITLHKPLRLWDVDVGLPVTVRASNGQPADCVTLAYSAVMDERADLVVSGINSGPNLGWDLTYSGTVGAAMEGAVLGISSIAISVAHYNDPKPINYAAAADFLTRLVPLMRDHPLPPHCLLNVNCPSCGPSDVAGVRVVRQGTRQYRDRLVSREDPWGGTYYWLGGTVVADPSDEGSDVQAVAQGCIAVTPVHLDLTHYDSLPAIASWIEALHSATVKG